MALRIAAGVSVKSGWLLRAISLSNKSWQPHRHMGHQSPLKNERGAHSSAGERSPHTAETTRYQIWQHSSAKCAKCREWNIVHVDKSCCNSGSILCFWTLYYAREIKKKECEHKRPHHCLPYISMRQRENSWKKLNVYIHQQHSFRVYEQGSKGTIFQAPKLSFKL